MPSTHCNLLYHIVFSTKERTPVLMGELHAAVNKYPAGIVPGLEGVPLEIGGVEDHVHILAKLKPTLAISDALRTMKTNSSKWINDERRRKARFEWQVGYAAFFVSESQVVPVRRTFAIRSSIIASRVFRRSLLPSWISMTLSTTRGICGTSVAPAGLWRGDVVAFQGLAPLAKLFRPCRRSWQRPQ